MAKMIEKLLLIVLKIQFVTGLNNKQTSNLIRHLIRHDPSFTGIRSLALITDVNQQDITDDVIMMDIPSVTLANMSLEALSSDIATHFIFNFKNESSLLEAMSHLKPQVFSPDNHYLFLTNFKPDYFELSYNANWSMYKNFCFGFTPESSMKIIKFVSPRRIGSDRIVTTNIWLVKQQEMLDSKSIFLEPSPDFHGKELLVTTFSYPPKIYESIASDGSLEFSGYEVMIIRTLADSLNFVPVFRKSADGLTWGGFFDGTKIMNGLKGDMQLGRTDIGMANLYMVHVDKTYFDYTYPYVYDAYCFLTKKPRESQNWVALVQPMTHTTWLFSLFTILVSLFLLLGFIRHYGPYTIGLTQEQAVLLMLGFLFGEHYHFTPKVNSLRLFLGPFMAGMTIIILGYSSTLKSFLVVTILPKPYNTISDLINLDIEIGNLLYSFNILHEFVDSPNPLHNLVADVFEPFPSYAGAFDRVSQGELSMMESKSFMDFMVRKNFTDKYGHTDFHIMDECWHSLELVALGLRNYSTIEPVLSFRLHQMQETGLTLKLIRDELNSVGRTLKDSQVEISEASPLSPPHLRTPAFVWGVLLIIAILVMMCEIGICNKRNNKNNNVVKQEDEQRQKFTAELLNKKYMAGYLTDTSTS